MHCSRSVTIVVVWAAIEKLTAPVHVTVPSVEVPENVIWYPLPTGRPPATMVTVRLSVSDSVPICV
jgi:hypothetical protein